MPGPDLTALLAELLLLGIKPDLGQLEGRLRGIGRLVDATQADALTRATLRSALVETLTTMKVHGPAALVDAALGVTRTGHGPGQGRSIALTPPTPWEEPVDGAALLEALVERVRRHVIMSAEAAQTIAALVLNAHAHDAAEVCPFGLVTSPTKRCGKTTLLILVSCLTPKALLTSNASPAAIFRTIEEHAPTLIIDEGDTFVRLQEELRGILNAGHTRDTAYVLRTVGEEHEPRIFSTWCPKFVGLIGALPDTLMDRAIVIPVRRRLETEAIARLRRDRIRSELAPLARQAARWAADHLEALREADPTVPESLHDREADNWRPLFAIGDQAGGPWPERLRKAARALSGGADPEDDEPAIAVLRDVGAIFADRKAKALPSAELVDILTGDPDGRWVEYGKARKPLSQRQLARLLGRLGIKPKVIRVEDKTPRGYELDDLTDPLSRYAPPKAQQAQHPAPGAAPGPFPGLQRVAGAADAESALSPRECWGVADVAEGEAGWGGEEEQGELDFDPDDPANDWPEETP